MSCTLCGKHSTHIRSASPETYYEPGAVLLTYCHGKAVCNHCAREITCNFARAANVKKPTV